MVTTNTIKTIGVLTTFFIFGNIGSFACFLGLWFKIPELELTFELSLVLALKMEIFPLF